MLTLIFTSLKVLKTMYTLRRLISNPFIRTSVRDSLPYSTKPKRVVRRYNRNNQADPGIKQRKRLLRNAATAEELEEVDFDGLESDFMSVHLSHKEFEEEVEARKEQEKYFIVGQKYFKEKLPNFLTMNDKLQMKHLHRMDPEQWTVEKLTESFPALPYIISKILKSNWTKKNIEKIKRHDEAVCENWEKFRRGELKDLPPDLTEHLKRFTNRELKPGSYNPSLYESETGKRIVYQAKPINTEFSDIITSYAKLTTKQTDQEKPPEELKLLGTNEEPQPLENKRQVRLTLPQLKKEIEVAVEKGKQISETEMLILNEVRTEDPRHEIVELKENVTAIQQRHEKPAQVGRSKTKKDYSFLEYPLKITIPAKVYKQGCTYKLNDCYYDERGTFLYRVPGMNA